MINDAVLSNDNAALVFPLVSDHFAISSPGRELLWTDVVERKVADYHFWTVVGFLVSTEEDATDAFSRPASIALQNFR